MTSSSRQVQAQYEAFPYPSQPMLALPRAEQARRIAWERGQEFVASHLGDANCAAATHDGKRILVAGCGTFEALLVAMAHPRAREIVAVDLSARSIARLQRRLAWARWAMRWSARGRLAPVRCVVADLWQWEDGPFDYIIASNVLHHATDPAGLLRRLAHALNPGGLMRVVTYPAASRLWLQQVGSWLRWHGVAPDTPGVARRAHELVISLPAAHPLRLCFESHSESRHATGVVDAFLHACEQPLPPLAWGRASNHSGLVLVGEDQNPLSSSDLLLNLLPQTVLLSPWERLEVLDRVQELSTNPVWWFVKPLHPSATTEGEWPLPAIAPTPSSAKSGWLTLTCDVTSVTAGKWRLPSAIFYTLTCNYNVADRLLARAQENAYALLEALRAEIGTHWSAVEQRALPGLALSDYAVNQLQQWHAPWGDEQWQELDQRNQGTLTLYYDGLSVPGATLTRQAQWLQLRYGALQPVLTVELQVTPALA